MTLIMVDNARWLAAVELAVFHEFLHRSLQYSLRWSADASREPGESSAVSTEHDESWYQAEKKKLRIFTQVERLRE